MNVTPDSFSDGGNFLSTDAAVSHAMAMLDQGADVIEVGGESTRPGATPVTTKTEIQRAIPVIEGILARAPGTAITIDTVKSAVAREAVAAGATIVNDVSGMRLDPEMARFCAEARCRVVLMHSRGSVADMASYAGAEYSHDGPMTSVIRELRVATAHATATGIERERIILDPGIGFSKRGEHSLAALAEIPRLAELGFEVMIGASRKRFIGEVTGMKKPEDRDAGTIGAHVVALTLGATWFRVHAVLAHRHALDVAVAILERRA